LRYEIAGDPKVVVACHCTHCQRQSGGAFGLTMVVARDEFHLLSGETRSFEMRADSGTEKLCFFCPDCGTRIYNALADGPNFNLKPGTLDDTSWFEPAFHVWTDSKQPWTPIPDGAKTFAKNPG
jgi:hypothetical protein